MSEIQPAYNLFFPETHEITVVPRFARNMIEIGKIVSRCGTPPPSYALNLIRFLSSCEDESRGFRAEVYLEPPDDPYMVLVKRGSPTPGIILPNYDHVSISYRPDTRTSLRVNKSEYPESQQFERPKKLPPGNLFIDHGTSIFLWMEASMLGPNTVSFLDKMTAEALAEFTALEGK